MSKRRPQRNPWDVRAGSKITFIRWEHADGSGLIFPLFRRVAQIVSSRRPLRKFLFDCVEPFFIGIVFEQLGITSPVHQGLELPFGLGFRKVLVQNVEQELFSNPPVLLLTNYFGYRRSKRDVLEKLFLEDLVAPMHVGGCELFTGVADRYISLRNFCEAEHGRSVHGG